MTTKLYIDIETIPDQRPDAFERYVSEVKPPANYKKQETIDKWMLENAENIALENFKKTGLTGLHGEICSISWAVDDGDIKAYTRTQSESETELLAAFWEDMYDEVRAVTSGDSNWPRLEWIGFNCIEFDLRFLKQRGLITQIKPMFPIPADDRHGNGKVFDLMKEWGGWRGYVKQSELVEAFGIEKPDWIDEDILSVDGSMVWEIWREGDYGLITEYNRLDVYYVRELYRRMA